MCKWGDAQLDPKVVSAVTSHILSVLHLRASRRKMHRLSIEESIGPLSTMVSKAENNMNAQSHRFARTLHVLEVTSGSSMVVTWFNKGARRLGPDTEVFGILCLGVQILSSFHWGASQWRVSKHLGNTIRFAFYKLCYDSERWNGQVWEVRQEVRDPGRGFHNRLGECWQDPQLGESGERRR